MLRWFRDEELQVDCVFARTEDGVVRCFPRSEATAAESSGGVVGLDPRNRLVSTGADCMVPAVSGSVCDFDFASGYVCVSSPMCGPGPVVREVFRLLTSLDELGSRNEDGICEVDPVSEDRVAYSLMSVDHTVFVAADQVFAGGVRTLVVSRHERVVETEPRATELTSKDLGIGLPQIFTDAPVNAVGAPL